MIYFVLGILGFGLGSLTYQLVMMRKDLRIFQHRVRILEEWRLYLERTGKA